MKKGEEHAGFTVEKLHKLLEVWLTGRVPMNGGDRIEYYQRGGVEFAAAVANEMMVLAPAAAAAAAGEGTKKT